MTDREQIFTPVGPVASVCNRIVVSLQSTLILKSDGRQTV